MAVVLALMAALAYGLSDFIGGLASRRTSAWPVAFTGSCGAIVGAIVLALFLPGHPDLGDLAWGALSGFGSGAGGAFLYRGFATGRMGVVAPVSAVGAALLPVLVGVVTGERPQLLAWLGIALAVPGIWLVSREPADGSVSRKVAAGLRDGVIAGIGFGVLFAAMGQVPQGAGFWPLVASQCVAMITIALTAVLLRESWLPRRRSDAWGLVCGVLSAVAVFAFLLATQRGLLAISSVLTALYPATTVLLAALVLKERVHRAQAGGLALCAATVALVSLG